MEIICKRFSLLMLLAGVLLASRGLALFFGLLQATLQAPGQIRLFGLLAWYRR